MTKIEMIKQVEALLVANKANKKLTQAIKEVLEEYGRRGSKKDDIQKDITINDKHYRWCNRHELYEPIENFTNDKPTTVACKLATKHWTELGKEVNKLQEELATALDTEDFKAAKEVNQKIKDLKLQRASRYNYKTTAELYPELDGYTYDVGITKEEAIQA